MEDKDIGNEGDMDVEESKENMKIKNGRFLKVIVKPFHRVR